MQLMCQKGRGVSNGLKMFENKPNEYWLNKFRLWNVLHGGGSRPVFNQKELCTYCLHDGGVHYCKLMRPAGEDGAWPVIIKNRLMVSRDLEAIEDCRKFYNLDWLCIEFIKHV